MSMANDCPGAMSPESQVPPRLVTEWIEKAVVFVQRIGSRR